MPLVVVQDVAPAPVDIGFLGASRHVSHSNGTAYPVQQFRLSGDGKSRGRVDLLPPLHGLEPHDG